MTVKNILQVLALASATALSTPVFAQTAGEGAGSKDSVGRPSSESMSSGADQNNPGATSAGASTSGDTASGSGKKDMKAKKSGSTSSDMHGKGGHGDMHGGSGAAMGSSTTSPSSK